MRKHPQQARSAPTDL